MGEVHHMPQPTRMERFKMWARRNEDKLVVGGIITGTVAFGALLVFGIKADNKYRAEQAAKAAKELRDWTNDMNDWLNAEREVGHLVYPLADGRYLTVAAEAAQQTVVK